MLRTSIAGLAIAAIAVTSAFATHLSEVQGTALVNKKAAGANTELHPGDRVKAVSGSAKIIYDNGAVVKVASGRTVVVLSNPPEIPHVGTEAGALDSPDFGYIAAGAAVAGGAGLAILLSSQHNGQPLSP
jgi:hypothetical protein